MKPRKAPTPFDLASLRSAFFCLTSARRDTLHTGTGFAIANPAQEGDVLVATCQHVVEMLGGLSEVRVHGSTAVSWSEERIAPSHDLSLFRAPGIPRPVANVPIATVAPQVGDDCLLFGWHWLDQRLLCRRPSRSEEI